VYILTVQVVLESEQGDQLPTLSTTRNPFKALLPDSVTVWAITCVILYNIIIIKEKIHGEVMTQTARLPIVENLNGFLYGLYMYLHTCISSVILYDLE